MARRQLTIAAPRGYPWTFNGPKRSRHAVRVRPFLPLNRLRSSLDGITMFSPLDTAGADLVHAFNRIPLGIRPFIIGFESHLPRTWGLEGTVYERELFRLLLAGRCRRIVAISNFAAANFRAGLAAAPLADDAKAELLAKLEVRYPNLDVAERRPDRTPPGDRLVATFVGGHFGRKGGCAVARMAELAHERRLPIEFHIVSSLEAGGAIWTDPRRDEFFAPYKALLTLPNVVFRPKLPNREVLGLLRRSHVCLLPTFADTFGFSVLEAMAAGTPAIASAQAALPEVIEHGVDGLLLRPARTPGQESWIWPYQDRDRPEFEQLFAAEIERFATEGFGLLCGLLDDQARLERMSSAAHRKARALFNSEDARAYWDELYVNCLERRGRRQPTDPEPATPLTRAGASRP